MIRLALILALVSTTASAQDIPAPPAGTKIGRGNWSAFGDSGRNNVVAVRPADCGRSLTFYVLTKEPREWSRVHVDNRC